MEQIKVLAVCGAQGAMFHSLLHTKKKIFQFLGNVEPRAVFHTKLEEQWNLNFCGYPFVRSLEELKDPKPDVIVGSPSCGHSSAFSYSRKKKLGNPKEDPCLTLFVQSVLTLKPKVFFMENLPKLLELIPLDEWKKSLSDYRFVVHTHSVIAFGNSQKSRKRLLLIGIRKDMKWKIDQILSKIDTPDTYQPMLVKDLEKLVIENRNHKEALDKKLAMYQYWDKSKRTLTVYEVQKLWTGKFKKEYKWPMIGTKMNTLPGVYRNRPDAYPMTLRPSNRQFNPEGWPMGLDEFRVIMGFPRSYKVYYDPQNPTYWLNKGRNALAKGSVYEMGLWVKRILKKCYKILISK